MRRRGRSGRRTSTLYSLRHAALSRASSPSPSGPDRPAPPGAMLPGNLQMRTEPPAFAAVLGGPLRQSPKSRWKPRHGAGVTHPPRGGTRFARELQAARKAEAPAKDKPSWVVWESSCSRKARDGFWRSGSPLPVSLASLPAGQRAPARTARPRANTQGPVEMAAARTPFAEKHITPSFLNGRSCR
jgi:hypothetical protein